VLLLAGITETKLRYGMDHSDEISSDGASHIAVHAETVGGGSRLAGSTSKPEVSTDAVRAIPAEFAKRHRIVPVSIDAAQDRVMLHAQGQGWARLEHYWAGGGASADFESPAARAFVVSGVPESILIGRDGRILWRGHPLDKSKDLKSRIDDALK
jgi:hypothetical protein